MCKKDNMQACASNTDCLSNSCSGGVCTGPSCFNLADNCGPDGNESCCASGVVPGGTFNRFNNPGLPATLSGFRLDSFEVTVGRFRSFLKAYPDNKPVAGAGAHPKIANSGWNIAWNSQLPDDENVLVADLNTCTPTTWTDDAASNPLRAKSVM
jgi:hypothetical protein